jgi:hypothetical protein
VALIYVVVAFTAAGTGYWAGATHATETYSRVLAEAFSREELIHFYTRLNEVKRPKKGYRG